MIIDKARPSREPWVSLRLILSVKAQIQNTDGNLRKSMLKLSKNSPNTACMYVQSPSIRFYLSCVFPRPGEVMSSRNLEQSFLSDSVHYGAFSRSPYFVSV